MPFSQSYIVSVAFFDAAISKTVSASLGNKPWAGVKVWPLLKFPLGARTV